MFKLPSQIPTLEDSVEVLTDYLEFECIKDGRISLLGKINKLLFQNDEVLVQGIEDETDQALAKTEEISQEIERRAMISEAYPFKLERGGYRLDVVNNTSEYWVYVYLLLSTRLNMNAHKKHSDIDGTELLEYLSAEVVKNYFGVHSQSMVFGTAVQGGFKEKINDLCTQIGEGAGYKGRGKITGSPKDDKLDVVVWVDFKDKYWSKLIGFGQCKTGTTFDDQATIELQPRAFCEKWLIDTPVIEPIKMFFCSQNYPIVDYSKVKNAGLVFDRMRIMDCLTVDTLPDSLHKKITMWCTEALAFIQDAQ
ncbi:hypothetical protein [Runella limosa]|uniref:hypothetical protein n=1 Tax=Runella limosa TaxID=370978 RepID=UPI00040C9AA0|nr:hypothetical protein [Runella limosa]